MTHPKDLGFNFDTTYLDLPDTFFTSLPPSPATSPKIVVFNTELAETLGLSLSTHSQDDLAALFSGNTLPHNATPFAQAYAGHQFGHFTMLGDGRAHMLGEHVTPDGHRFDIQFKGSGRTPYSRSGDGRAVLGPMLREYIMSEALHALGIPTTRSLAVVTTGDDVLREAPLPGAVLTRVATSHIRVGTFEFAASHPDETYLKALLTYTLNRHFPDLQESPNPALAFLNAMMDRQANLITDWMRVGFIHGVMNTDNMTISGETIDYGPCAFMDAFDSDTVFSSIDRMGRYSYGNQPVIAQWNLSRLAGAILPLLDTNEATAVSLAQESIETFPTLYKTKWMRMMRAKLGLHDSQPEDEHLIATLLDWMTRSKADFTHTFRSLSQHNLPTESVYNDTEFTTWHNSWQQRLQDSGISKQDATTLMTQHNPIIIPRNHNVETALDAATEGNMDVLYDLLHALQDPYTERPDIESYTSPPEPRTTRYQTYCGT